MVELVTVCVCHFYFPQTLTSSLINKNNHIFDPVSWPLQRQFTLRTHFQIDSYFFPSSFRVDCSLTCPAGVTVAFREAQGNTCSVCCCTPTVSQYVTYTIQRLICCMWTANGMLDSGRAKGYRVKVQPHSAGEPVDAYRVFLVEWMRVCVLRFEVV